MDISVIIPTYNRLHSLKRVLATLEYQTLQKSIFEIVVVSDGATDGTNEFLDRHKTALNLRPIYQKNSGVAAARNAGIQMAEGDLVVFIDDDVVPSPQLLAEHIRVHAVKGDNVVVLGPMLTPSDFNMTPWVQWEQAMLMKQYSAMANGEWEPTPRQFYTGNTSLRRSHLLEEGGFDTQFNRAEDVELAYRLADKGLSFVFNGEAIGYHYAERNFASWLGIPYAYGRNDVIFACEKGQAWLLAVIWQEHKERHVLIRVTTRLFLDRPLLNQPFLKLLEKAALSSFKFGLKNLVAQAYSGIFNLRYYQGVADQLGGRDAFFSSLSKMTNLEPDQLATDTNLFSSHNSMMEG